MCLVGFPLSAGKGERQLGISDIEGVKKWLMMEQRGIVDIERDFTDKPESLLLVFGIEDTDVLRDQAAKWIEGQAADRSFHAVFVQFLDYAITLLLAKPFFP